MTQLTGAAGAPRIPPVAPGERTAEQDRLLPGPLGEAGVFTTLVRHPELFRDWLRFGDRLLRKGLLSDRDRELLILRTAYLCGAVYEWGHHVPFALQAGLRAEEVERVAAGPDAPGLPAADALLLRAADELVADKRIGDDTWAALSAAYGEQELIEILMLVGQYVMLGGALNTLGVRLEDGYDAPSWQDER